MRQCLRSLAVLWAVFACGPAARGDAYDPPAAYYSSATATGAALKQQLHNIIDGHSVVSYDAARSALQTTDQDPADPDRMILVYNRQSINVAAINPNGSIPGWDNAATWNREHTWPESRLGDGGRAVSDLFNLRPSKTSVNSDRENLNFGGAFGQPFGEVTDKGSVKWYPGDLDAGMIARQEFYMAVRYDGGDSGTSNLELAANNPSGSGQLGDLDRLIEWHFAAPPDEFERRRNDVIYEQYQGNRNPFIDRPEYAWSIFVNQSNDSSLTLQGAAAAADGGTSLNLDFGRVLVGAPVPAAQTVILNKSGLNGTYFNATTSGAATSSLAGRRNAFRTGATGSQALTVGLATSTATPGAKSGAVTIDNLDVTSAGGAGRGAHDADDVVQLSLDVLSHANPSFAADTDVDSLAYDFGVLALGAGAATFSFDLFNLESTTGYTAGLQLDEWSAVGDVDLFSTNLASFGDDVLGAGAARSFQVTLSPSAVGDYAASFTLRLSDEDLPGAASLSTMEISLTGTVEAALPPDADFDGNGTVDGADFLLYQRGYGASPTAQNLGDANGDEVVDAGDLQVWQTQFGAAGPTLNTMAPEPTALVLAAIPCLLAAARRRRIHPPARPT